MKFHSLSMLFTLRGPPRPVFQLVPQAIRERSDMRGRERIIPASEINGFHHQAQSPHFLFLLPSPDCFPRQEGNGKP